MAYRVPITVRLERFEGPLDLLLYLIQSHALDVSAVSITKITDQYLAYVKLMQELDFDVASEFLVMAATLLFWKSRSLLPKEETQATAGADGEVPLTQEELVRQLLEHQRFREAGASLAQLPLLGLDVFVRANSKPPVERVNKSMDLSELTLTIQDVLTRARKRTQILKKETVSITERMRQFGEQLRLGQVTALRQIMSLTPDRPELVVTFLAALELGRLKTLKLFQEKTYEMIYVELVESLTNFNFELANGFESEIQAQVGAANDTSPAFSTGPNSSADRATDLSSAGNHGI